MAQVSLRMISICALLLLLILNDRSSSSAPSPVPPPAPSACPPAASDGSRCITEDQFNKRTKKLHEKRSEYPEVPKNPSPDNRTCSQAANEMRGDLSNRSLSPWRYRINEDDDRFPPVIYMAECLCQGCIIGDKESRDYDSVPVNVVQMVLKRTKCKSDSNKYMMEKHFIEVPVACACVVPKKIVRLI